MKTMSCTPSPIPSEHITLPPELSALTERLAENAHDLWAQQRLADGWTCGPARDENAKKHPRLVSDVHLPESEKEYDRRTALGTVKAILALGSYSDSVDFLAKLHRLARATRRRILNDELPTPRSI